MMQESRTDILINRIASHEESRGEFTEFEAAAEKSPREWERLARALRDELHVRGALNDALGGEGESEISRAYEVRYAASGSDSRFRLRAWSGWAAAALIALAWTIVFAVDSRPAFIEAPRNEARQLGVQLASLTADEALEQYLRAGENEGRIVAELPTVLVESFKADDGRLEVYYVRQLLERDRVGAVYELAPDEHGAYVPVEISPAALLSMPSSM